MIPLCVHAGSAGIGAAGGPGYVDDCRDDCRDCAFSDGVSSVGDMVLDTGEPCGIGSGAGLNNLLCNFCCASNNHPVRLGFAFARPPLTYSRKCDNSAGDNARTSSRVISFIGCATFFRMSSAVTPCGNWAASVKLSTIEAIYYGLPPITFSTIPLFIPADRACGSSFITS